MLTSSVLALAVARRTVPVIGWRPRQNNCCTDVAGRAFLDALSILGLAAPGRMLSARFRSERWLQSLGGLKRMDRRSWLLSSGTHTSAASSSSGSSLHMGERKNDKRRG